MEENPGAYFSELDPAWTNLFNRETVTLRQFEDELERLR